MVLLFGENFLMGQNSWKKLRSSHDCDSCTGEGTEQWSSSLPGAQIPCFTWIHILRYLYLLDNFGLHDATLLGMVDWLILNVPLQLYFLYRSADYQYKKFHFACQKKNEKSMSIPLDEFLIIDIYYIKVSVEELA